jgi:hypothetical protein
MNDKQFRFQDLEVWKRAAQFSPKLFRLADQLEAKRRFRFVEQLRAQYYQQHRRRLGEYVKDRLCKLSQYGTSFNF